jgi:hypothetical protein
MFDRRFAQPRPLHEDDPVVTGAGVVDGREVVGVVAHLFSDEWLMYPLAGADEPQPTTVYFSRLLDEDPTLDEIRDLDRGGLAVRRPGEPWRHTRFWSDGDFRRLMAKMRG